MRLPTDAPPLGELSRATERVSWHDLSSSRGQPLKVWKGSRSAGRRPECLRQIPFRRSRALRAAASVAGLAPFPRDEVRTGYGRFEGGTDSGSRKFRALISLSSVRYRPSINP
jgi:hypothetical protein